MIVNEKLNLFPDNNYDAINKIIKGEHLNPRYSWDEITYSDGIMNIKWKLIFSVKTNFFTEDGEYTWIQKRDYMVSYTVTLERVNGIFLYRGYDRKDKMGVFEEVFQKKYTEEAIKRFEQDLVKKMVPNIEKINRDDRIFPISKYGSPWKK